MDGATPAFIVWTATLGARHRTARISPGAPRRRSLLLSPIRSSRLLQAVQEAAPPSPASLFDADTASDAKRQLLTYLVSKKRAVDAALEASVQASVPGQRRLAEAMRYSLLADGKRVRPILVLAACELFGGDDAMAMPTAVAVEMVHCMSLIHDDLPAMDNDDYRRGQPTNHKKFGEDVAILAGDALLSESFAHIAEHTPIDRVPPARVLEVVRRLAQSVGLNGLAAGQAMDLECEGKPAEQVGVHALEWIHLHKTAALLRFSVMAGAILAGADADDVQHMEAYANRIGLAFQIADDVLDVVSSTETLGKTAGKDSAVDKATFPRLLGLEASRLRAEQLVHEAKQALERYGGRAGILLGLADFIIQRKN
ncbi:hypothetical protein CDCA_CDCA04G1393 [Cyanidium caldarium]|uniref:Geranylgeranyl diphosphate synthase n=1 Tax=Cyanidium caldarium TaxID=2771 RepID=A0AAV9IU45_CYACA|nr:hypothetical protein CDCA_CDCA04G1393 [Cyanidium caldarium]